MKAAASIGNMMSGNIIPLAYEYSELRPEAEIVLLCSRSRLSTDQIDRVSSMLAQEPDTEYIFSLAHRNGVLPLVCNNLLENFRYELTEETRAMAGELCRQHALRNLSMTGKLLEILRMFESEGIASVPFKGPTLAMRLYNSTTLRQFIDLDILVMPRHFDRAIDLLLDNGYKIFPDNGHRSRNTFRINRRKDVSLMHPDDKYRVELHWKLSGSHFSMPLQLSRLWRRMATADLGGVRLSTLPFNDLFVYLCLHAARHGFERLEWICDLNELIRSEKVADWNEVREHARVHGCERVVELALFLVLDFFGTRAPYPEFHRIEADGQFAKIARTVRDRLFNDEPTSNGIGDWYGYHLMLKEKRSDRIKLHMFYIGWYLKLIFRPNSADKAIFPLPASFYPLYFILRPARLIYNYFSKQTPMR
jgi:hypothetical protein